jgi:hypothetical protein
VRKVSVLETAGKIQTHRRHTARLHMTPYTWRRRGSNTETSAKHTTTAREPMCDANRQGRSSGGTQSACSCNTRHKISKQLEPACEHIEHGVRVGSAAAVVVHEPKCRAAKMCDASRTCATVPVTNGAQSDDASFGWYHRRKEMTCGDSDSATEVQVPART